MNDKTPSAAADSSATRTVSAVSLPDWTVGELPAPPDMGLRSWMALLGPGLLMAGVAVGAGEWLFGPAVTGQYGATLLWLATISIVCQLFINIEVMRYAIYCGEPIYVGYLRTWPGPKFWILWYLLIDISNIWPFMAATAAVPLAAALLGHLPGDAIIQFAGITLTEVTLVKVLGYAVFLLAFVPLIFGGTIYRSIERLMSLKIVLVLGFLCVMAFFTVSPANMREVLIGFFRIGVLPLRADTIIVGPHFDITQTEGPNRYTIKGTFEGKIETGNPLVTAFVVEGNQEVKTFGMHEDVPAELADARQRLLDRTKSLAKNHRFFVEDTEQDLTLRLAGQIMEDQTWKTDQIEVSEAGQVKRYDHLQDLPSELTDRAEALVANQGVKRTGVVRYLSQHGRLPNLNWAMLAAFAAIAGIGGTSNTLLSNYARDKGWGMGKLVGAIPSAVGGSTVTLSHVGKVFPLDEANLRRWRGWMRYILRDQAVVWMLCCFVGMALPCMISLEFIRNVPVEGHRVSAVIADGAARRYPELAWLLWPAVLFCGFLVLAPGQIFSGEAIARRWTDVVWTTSSRARRLQGNRVKYIYYCILALYAVWGVIWLSLFEPLTLAIIGSVLGNVALSFTSFHALYVNRSLLPDQVKPNWFMQAGLFACGTFFLGLSLIVWSYL